MSAGLARLRAMPRPALSPRDRRALRLGTLVLAPTLAWLLVVAPYRRAVDDASQRLDSERRLLAGEARLLAAAPLLPAAAAAGRSRLVEASARMLAGGAGEAGAALAAHVDELADQEAVVVTRMDPRPASAGGDGLVAIAIEVSGRADLGSLLMLLRAFERGERLVHIDSLEVRARDAADAYPADAYAADAYAADAYAGGAPATLAFRFVATGFALADRSTAARD